MNFATVKAGVRHKPTAPTPTQTLTYRDKSHVSMQRYTCARNVSNVT